MLSRVVNEGWKPENDPNWRKVESESLKWPTTNKPCKEVFRSLQTGHIITRRFNEMGDLIFSNESKFKLRCVIA